MTPSLQLVVFTLDGYFYALELATVHRVVRALEVTPLPNAPAVILGIINVHGELMPVVSLRHRFRLPERAISLSDQFVIANMTTQRGAQVSTRPVSTRPVSTRQTSTRRVALWVDAIAGVRVVAEESIVVGEELGTELEVMQGIAKVADDLILIHNLARCLSLREAKMLDDALAEMDT